MNRDALHQEIVELRAKVADLTFELNELKATYHDFKLPGAEGIRFTPRERAVLKALHDRCGQVVTKEQLFARTYDSLFTDADLPDDNILAVFICKLRRKLRGSPWVIETRYGVGWFIRPAEGQENGS